jgi:hypothetical protein
LIENGILGIGSIEAARADTVNAVDAVPITPINLKTSEGSKTNRWISFTSRRSRGLQKLSRRLPTISEHRGTVALS